LTYQSPLLYYATSASSLTQKVLMVSACPATFPHPCPIFLQARPAPRGWRTILLPALPLRRCRYYGDIFLLYVDPRFLIIESLHPDFRRIQFLILLLLYNTPLKPKSIRRKAKKVICRTRRGSSPSQAELGTYLA
jgi:hypothetical protein